MTEDGTLHNLYQRWWNPQGEACPVLPDMTGDEPCLETGTTKDIENMSKRFHRIRTVV